MWPPKDSLRYVGKPYFKPGLDYPYSNTNYLVLGMLAEAVGGAPIGEQFRSRFTIPLGLGGTVYQAARTPTVAPAHAYRFPQARR